MVSVLISFDYLRLITTSKKPILSAYLGRLQLVKTDIISQHLAQFHTKIRLKYQRK